MDFTRGTKFRDFFTEHDEDERVVGMRFFVKKESEPERFMNLLGFHPYITSSKQKKKRDGTRTHTEWDKWGEMKDEAKQGMVVVNELRWHVQSEPLRRYKGWVYLKRAKNLKKLN